jgi:mRNA interferase RelE/StbE
VLNYRISFTEKALSDIDTLSVKEFRRVVSVCERLETNPLPEGKHIKKLKGYRGLYRLRIGNYRVVYQLKGSEIFVIRILTRQDFGKQY